MKRRIFVGAAALPLLLLLVGCEQVFSTNIFSGLDRDPSRLSFEQQVNYGHQAVHSGNRKKMAKAYDALADSLQDNNNKDPELNSLAATLALGASGLSGLLADFFELASNTSFGDAAALGAALDDKLDKVNYSYIDAAVEQIEAIRDNGGTPSEQQYVFAAIGLVLKAGSENNNQIVGSDTTELDAFLTPFAEDYADSSYLEQLQSL
ncbi:MAG: hypothetical protein EA404_12865 [Spirochaetaceae bacterium]|nr:MAG: hypothetical protein EA404_12865 [Spirochaetaceae bacterium]